MQDFVSELMRRIGMAERLRDDVRKSKRIADASLGVGGPAAVRKVRSSLYVPRHVNALSSIRHPLGSYPGTEKEGAFQQRCRDVAAYEDALLACLVDCQRLAVDDALGCAHAVDQVAAIVEQYLACLRRMIPEEASGFVDVKGDRYEVRMLRDPVWVDDRDNEFRMERSRGMVAKHHAQIVLWLRRYLRHHVPPEGLFICEDGLGPVIKYRGSGMSASRVAHSRQFFYCYRHGSLIDIRLTEYVSEGAHNRAMNSKEAGTERYTLLCKGSIRPDAYGASGWLPVEVPRAA